MHKSKTYQELSKEIQKELLHLPDHEDQHNFFFKLKQKQPARFARLKFDENGHEPFSKDLENILTDLVLSGKYNPKYD